jgi:hypothetical protein
MTTAPLSGAPLPGAVLMRAEQTEAGDLVCFHWKGANYRVEEIETDSLGRVRHRTADNTHTCSYHPGELLWVARGGES